MRIRSVSIALTLAVVVAACGGTAADNGDAADDALQAPSEPATTTTVVETTTSVSEADETTTTAEPSSTTAEESADDDSNEAEAPREDVDDDDAAPGETVPTTTEPERSITGEVPEAFLDAVLTDASDQSGVAIVDLTVLRAEYVEWPDGSLGCPEPGVVYTQAITPGYWVEIGAGERTLDYRLNESGAFRLCGGVTTPHDDGGSTEPGGDS